MRNKLIIFLLLLLVLVPNAQVFAEETNDAEHGIELDGDFKDWKDKPSVKDKKHDSGQTWTDFLEVGYFADDEYLYLRVDRQSAKKSEPWHFNVVMLNATVGNPIEQYPFGDEPIYAPQFDIVTDNQIVEVNFEGEQLESTLSAASNEKEIEFRVPLASVGLDGLNKEVEFMLKSNEENREEVDWVADGRPIIITTGPTLSEFTTIICFASISFIAYKTIKKRNTKVSFN